ncbi:exo-beta-N-acetylmuramidase NamZ domain-containing protein [Flavobacterium sp.]|uniref:exo-beta-N-acetylmuramidase NamZ family protein n=1 Tax=Flavobacterium sp. TaxID=239 RepID=UPI0035271295
MIPKLLFKNTFLFLVLLVFSCGNSTQSSQKSKVESRKSKTKDIDSIRNEKKIITGAENFSKYSSLLKDKKVGVLTNQTGIIEFTIMKGHLHEKESELVTMSIVDFFLEQKINVRKIFAPEHGFRGTADAGELIKDGKDTKTGLPIISLYGNNKKPKPEQINDLDIIVFDLQDVGARFYTYISTLHYVMEACAEVGIPLIILDRPNPNIAIVDGPILETEFKSFVGMHKIPVLHGMTIGEYAKMINGEKWLNNNVQCELTVIPCENYARNMSYSLPVKPSPNLPNDKAINLYASLCFFEGTNVSVGRGTNKQFQIYGSPYLLTGKIEEINGIKAELIINDYTFTPKPNEGAKEPLYNGIECHGVDLSEIEKVNQLELKWLINAYNETPDKSKFFNSFFTKLAGTKKLQQQIETGVSENEIRASWQDGLDQFKEIREKYLIYE